MIRRFRSRALKRLFERNEGSRLVAHDVPKLRRILARLDASSGPTDMDAPGFRLHALKGNFRGYWAVTVRANWRVVFRFEGNNAVDVDLIDYH